MCNCGKNTPVKIRLPSHVRSNWKVWLLKKEAIEKISIASIIFIPCPVTL